MGERSGGSALHSWQLCIGSGAQQHPWLSSHVAGGSLLAPLGASS